MKTERLRTSLRTMFFALIFPLAYSCGSNDDAMDTDGALDIVAAHVARIDTTQYKIYELNWYDDNGDNSLRMVGIEMIGRNDSCYEYTVFRSYGSPKPQIKLASPSTVPRLTFDKTRGIDFASERRFILPNIERMKQQIPAENEFQSVDYCTIVCGSDDKLYHTVTLNLDGKGAHLAKQNRINSRATRRMEYRTMRGIMREGKELEVKVDEVK